MLCSGHVPHGQSFFLNRLAGSEGGFWRRRDNRTMHERCVVVAPADLKTSDGATLLLMDTEGRRRRIKMKRMTPRSFASLLYSHFVLNVVGVIDDSTVERLHL